MRNLFEEEGAALGPKKIECKEKYEITKENILNNFDYYKLLPLEKILNFKFVELHNTRMDLTAKNKKPIKSQTGEIGIVEYGNFYSYKNLKKTFEETEVIAEIICNALKLKKLQSSHCRLDTDPVELVYWGSYYKEVWQLILEDDEWYLIRLEDIPHNQVWGD